ncbi:MAG: helix-turn-helix domain-containing protein [Clostridia bacterium]|nr:helix-turn-helix domain-containing protein [Clostridia bacterium]
MNTLFSDNLKKFRQRKNYTQEFVADKLGVSSHTVSRWECGTTLPDVLLLPEIARLYEVTVDDFYKKSTVAYDNYAQRLSSVYENSRDPEDFMRCRNEYLKLIKQGTLSTADKWQYGWIHMYMMNYCRDIAVEWYDKAVADNPEDDPQNYSIACMQRIWMFFLLKKEDEIISELKEKVKANPDDHIATDNLLIALIWAEKNEEAYSIFKKAIQKFPDDWHMYIHGGEIAKALKKYDEALEYYDKAGEIGTYFCDEMDCKSNLYAETGEYEKAYNEKMKMAAVYRQRGYDVEAEMVEKQAKEYLEKMNK